MQLLPIPEDVARAGLRALHTVALADGELSPLETAFIEAVQTNVLRSRIDLGSLVPIAPSELAEAVTSPEHRQRILTGAVVTSCIDGKTTEDEVAVIESFARAMRLDLAPVHTARKLAKDQLLLARIDIARRALAGHKIRQTAREQGPLAILEQFGPLMGRPDPALTERYRGLRYFTPGTLGRGYHDFIASNGFTFPGEEGAGPEIIVVHDCLHVIGGYGTSAREEIDVSSFQAACHGGDPLYGLLFGLAQYHLGVQVAPVAAAEKLHADPATMMRAFARGAEIRRDMWSDFAPWDHFAKPLPALRAELGLKSER
jgi:tellurite resistance protein